VVRTCLFHRKFKVYVIPNFFFSIVDSFVCKLRVSGIPLECSAENFSYIVPSYHCSSVYLRNIVVLLIVSVQWVVYIFCYKVMEKPWEVLVTCNFFSTAASFVYKS
jgi:hypothetical protein